MKKIGKGLLFLGLGVIALIVSSYTRTFKAEYIQFSTLIPFFLLCGWLLSRFCDQLWPFPLLFFFPTVSILVVALITNHQGFFHYVGEIIMIIPCFFIGFYFFRWPLKTRIITAILLPAFYLLYILKIGPELDYYNRSVRANFLFEPPKEPIPFFVFQKPDKSSLDLAEYRGKVILIDFYFNRCSQCIKKMPDLKKLQNHYKENKDFVLLSVHRGGSESFDEFLTMLHNFPSELSYAYDSSSRASKHLGIEGYPHEILIDKKGLVRDQFGGYSDDVSLVYKKNLIKKIDALLNEKN